MFQVGDEAIFTCYGLYSRVIITWVGGDRFNLDGICYKSTLNPEEELPSGWFRPLPAPGYLELFL